MKQAYSVNPDYIDTEQGTQLSYEESEPSRGRGYTRGRGANRGSLRVRSRTDGAPRGGGHQISFCTLGSKKISNDQELIQSDPISCPQNQKGNN